jgi:hypothetical protein
LAALQPGGVEQICRLLKTQLSTKRNTDSGKLQAAAKKCNAIAVMTVTLAFTTDGTMAWVYKSKTRDWPNGLAHMITDASLKHKYQPQDTMSIVELRHQLFNKVMFKKDADLATLFEEISAIENKYNTLTR